MPDGMRDGTFWLLTGTPIETVIGLFLFGVFMIALIEWVEG